jgi:Domain of unknown function (DUF397)
MANAQRGLLWRKSSSCTPSECVEVAITRDRVFIRDSKDRSGPVLEVSRDDWRTFAARIAQINVWPGQG